MGVTEDEEQYPPRVLFTGDYAIGKTTALIRYKTGAMPKDYTPTIYDSFSITVPGTTIDSEPVKVEIWEAHSREDYDRLRPLSYSISNVVVICYPAAMAKFALARRHEPTIMGRCHSIYISEWQHHAPDQPAILLRTMCDLDDPAVRDEAQYSYCTWEEAEAMSSKYHFAHHLKCSAITGEGIAEALDTAAKLAIEHRSTEKRRKIRRKQPGRCLLM